MRDMLSDELISCTSLQQTTLMWCSTDARCSTGVTPRRMPKAVAGSRRAVALSSSGVT